MEETFNSINELICHIQDDKRTPYLSFRRFPIRFIFLPNVWNLKCLVYALGNLGINKIELVDFLPNPDGWLTVDEITRIFKRLDTDKDHVVTSLSELMRFYSNDDFVRILNRLSIEIENTEYNNQERRLYVPLIGTHERFSTLFSPRKEWAPVWVLSGEEEIVRIFLIDFVVKKSTYAPLIRSARDFLNLWKKEKTRRVICCSRSLYCLCENETHDKAFEIEKVKNIRELILKVTKIDIPIVYRTQDTEHWDNLWRMENENLKNFNEVIKDNFNRIEIGRNEIVDLWLNRKDKYSRWLLKWYVMGKEEWKDSYVYRVLESAEDLEDSELIGHLWFAIFEFRDLKKEWIDERRNYLRAYYSKYNHGTSEVEEKLKSKLDNVKDSERKLHLLTDITPIERKLAVEMAGEFRKTREDYLIILREIYPHLFYYLMNMNIDNIEPDNEWIEKYFEEYRWSKLLDSKSAELGRILFEKSADKKAFYSWYYSFRNTRFLLMNEKFDRIIWIDALGAEWESLLTRIIEDKGLIIEKKFICRANLPTDTTCNKFENCKHVQALDSYVHSNLYKYPDSLVDEIEIIEKIIEEHFSSDEKTLIISDHGFTAFARAIDDNIKKYDFRNSSHEGRFVWIEDDLLEDEDFIIHIPEYTNQNSNRKCVIALRHSSLHNLAKREVHGGATPEEVLVPAILVSGGTRGAISYKVDPQKQEISVRDPVIHLSIEPVPRISPSLVYRKDRIFNLKYDDLEKKWISVLKDLKTGEYELEVEIGNWEGKIFVVIRGGMKERDLL